MPFEGLPGNAWNLDALFTGTVRVFDRSLQSRMPLSFTPLLRLQHCHACDQWHECSLLYRLIL
jgi:hypothetical protein